METVVGNDGAFCCLALSCHLRCDPQPSTDTLLFRNKFPLILSFQRRELNGFLKAALSVMCLLFRGIMYNKGFISPFILNDERGL